MVPLVGSGKFVKMTIVSEDGQPLEESSADNQEWLVKDTVTDKRVLQWMLVLSQIGMVGCLLIYYYVLQVSGYDMVKCRS